jgi:hypothetical protein
MSSFFDEYYIQKLHYHIKGNPYHGADGRFSSGGGSSFGSSVSNNYEKLSEEEKTKYLQKEYQPWVSNLSHDELGSIQEYTRNTGYDWNTKLRDGEMGKNSYDINVDDFYTPEHSKLDLNEKMRIQQATQALMRGKAPDDLVMNRSVNSVDAVKDLENHIGETYTDPAFCSTSADDMGSGGVKTGHCSMTVRVPKGTHGAYVSGLSAYSGEKEFLLPPGTRYKVLSVKKTDVIGKNWAKDPINPPTEKIGENMHIDLQVVGFQEPEWLSKPIKSEKTKNLKKDKTLNKKRFEFDPRIIWDKDKKK